MYRHHTMNSTTIRFIRRGGVQSIDGVAPDRTLLDLLREDLACTGTKEGCGEGDCGACTVVVGEAEGDRLRYRALNACIALAHSISGKALWTAEDLAQDPLVRPLDAATPPGSLHPVQQALVDHHGSQCGFCTPGFVMSLFALYQTGVCQGRGVSRAQAVQDLSGNLCRCTGYRPILDAAQQMDQLPRWQVDEAVLLQKLELLAHDQQALEPNFAYISPATLAELLERVLEPRAGRDHTVFERRRLTIAGPVQGIDHPLYEIGVFLEHRLHRFGCGVLAARQPAHFGQASEFVEHEHHVFQRGDIAHGESFDFRWQTRGGSERGKEPGRRPGSFRPPQSPAASSGAAWNRSATSP